jgi:hypothetical protein
MSVELSQTEIRPYSPGELARFSGVSVWTLNRWLKRHKDTIGERDGLYYTALQVRTIFDKLGLPGKFEEK